MSKKKTLFLLAILLLLGVSITPHSYAFDNETNMALPILSEYQPFFQDPGSVNTELISSVTPAFSGNGQAVPDKLGCQVDWWDWFDVFQIRNTLLCGIIGDDDREAVENTTDVPWRAIVSFNAFFTNGIQGCTGFFIDPHTIATAAHCLYDTRAGRATSVRIYPARNGNDIPYGSYDVDEDSIFISQGWLNGQRRTEYDYGAIVLPNDDIGNQVGWFNLAVLNNQELADTYLHTAGYPWGTYFFDWETNCMFGHCKLMRDEEPMYDFNDSEIRYTLDTTDGQSGSAIWYESGSSVNVVGIVSNTCMPNVYNCAPRITESVVSDFQRWSRRPGPATLSLTVKLANPSSLNNFNHSTDVAVVALQSGTNQILFGPQIVTTDANGQYASLELTGLKSGRYAICAKAKYYLGQCAWNVNVNRGTAISLDFSNGNSRPAEPGDIDPYGGDNEINTLDSEMIKSEWRTYGGQSCPPCRFDMNRDGIFHAEDALLVIQRDGREYRGEGNFGRPFATQRNGSTASEGSEGSTRSSEASVGTGFARVEPTNVTKSVGEVFDASLFFDTGGNAVTGSDVKVYYDPAVLEVLDEDGGTEGIQISNAALFPNVYRNSVDPSEGIIWFSASYDLNDEQFNGSGTLATLRFRVLAGTPFSTQVYPVVESNTTNESNAAQFETAFDVLGSAAISTYTLNGAERPEPSISLSVSSNSDLNETLLHVTAQVNEPYNQVDCVDFNLVSDFDVPVSVSDCEGGDGWSALLDTSTLSDQTGVRMIGRVNLRTTQGDYSTTSENITLDRTNPNILSSNFSPQTPSPGESVQVEVNIDDNLSQQIYAELWVNRANDSSQNGEWVRVDETLVTRSSSSPPFVANMTWDTTGFDEGEHLIAITVQDDAGNWNSWSSTQTTDSSAVCPSSNRAKENDHQSVSSSVPCGVELVGQIGGSAEAVSVDGNYAYVGAGPRLLILDISNPSSPTKVAQTEVLPDTVNDVVVADRYAYVVTAGSGLHIFDIRNPLAPNQVGSFDNGYTAAVTVANNVAYLVNSLGLRIINVANPQAPTEMAMLDMSAASDVAVAGSYAYVTVADWSNNSGGLHIINISTPTPNEVAALDIGKAFAVAVANNIAYLITESSLRLINVASPTTASEVGAIDISFASDVTVVDNYAYVADSSSLRIIDVSNPAALREMDDYHIEGSGKGVAMAADMALVASSYGGLQLINVANPTNATKESTFDTWIAAGVAVANNVAYVSDGWDSHLYAIDVSNPATARELAVFKGSSSNWQDWRGVSVAGNHAYLGGDELSMFDIANPAAPTKLADFNIGEVYGGRVSVVDNYAYVAAGEDRGLRIIDISNRNAPFEKSTFDTPGYAYDVVVADNYAYIADGPQGGLRIIDISNPSAPRQEGSYDTQGDAYSVAVAGNYAYVTEGREGGLRIIDISNRSAPFEVGAIDTPGWAYDVEVVGRFAYVADFHYGLRLINVANPAAPIEVGSFDTAGYANNVTVVGGYAYLSTRHGGLAILRVTGPRSFQHQLFLPAIKR